MAPKNWQLVDQRGEFKNIGNYLNLARDQNRPIAAVSIIGVQSTGKSTLLNKCFSTDFQEMDERQERSQTTKGIWIAKGPSLQGGPKILLIDTEGSDSSEGNDTFERESAAFVMDISNTVIVNMKCENVGLRNGASRPLLETVFQVMLDKSTTTPPRVNLMFVLRDKNKRPLDKLEKQLREGLDEIWRGIYKSEANTNARRQDYFNVVVMTMSHYEKEEFGEEVEEVKNQLFSLVNNGQTYPASNFLDLAKRKWDDITMNTILKFNLNDPNAYEVFCRRIMREKRENFLQDQEWRKTEKAVGEYASNKNGTKLEGFGKCVNSIMGKYLSQYDKEIPNIYERTKKDYKKELTENLSLQVVKPSYEKLVAKMKEETLKEFVEEMVKEIAKEVESRGGKLEKITSNNFVDKFNGRLKDAHVELACWNHTSSQLKDMRSVLDSSKEEARSATKKLTTVKKSDLIIMVESAKLGGYVLSCVATLAAPPIAGVGALGLVVASPVVIDSIQSICQALSKRVETKKQIAEASGEAGLHGQILRAVGHEISKMKIDEKKDRK